MKAKIILTIVRFVMGAIALGIGVWYLSSSINGDAITYTSMNNFLNAIGAGDDIASTNGCFLCKYISDLFGILGNATEVFWSAIVNLLWMIMAIGFGIFLFIYTGQYIYDAAKKTAKLDKEEKKIELATWFDKVWRTGVRILICGAILGMLGMGGTTALRYVTRITVTPVMFVGSELGMAATGISDSSKCGAITTTDNSDDILNPVLQPFMCSIGNLNATMLAGAAGGFSMMNYAWMGMGGGAITWLAGLGLVIMFLIIGFDLFFQVLSVVFKLIFIIIFMPLFIAAAAFEPVWKFLSDSKLINKVIDMLGSAAVSIISISLKIVIIYATVSFVADAHYPGPVDGFSTVLPPMFGQTVQNPDARTLSVMNTFSECEHVALSGGAMDATKFKDCFTAHRAMVERKYPGAFDFLGDGWGFLMMMIGLFALYYWVVSPEIDKIFKPAGKSDFDFGGNIKKLGKNIWNLPVQATGKITSALGKTN